MELTHIYYNPVSGNVTNYPKDGYIAFVNAKDVGKTADEKKLKEEQLYSLIEELTREGLHIRAEEQLYRKLYGFTPIIGAAGCSIIFMEDPIKYLICAILCVVYLGIMAYLLERTLHQHICIESTKLKDIVIQAKEECNNSNGDEDEDNHTTGDAQLAVN